jgi:thioredoxin-like negative regulator of GroEL
MLSKITNFLMEKKGPAPIWVWLVAIILGVSLYLNPSKKTTKPSVPQSISQDKKIKIYNFNTSRCGWSVKFQPEWNKFQHAVNSDPTLSSRMEAVDVKCDSDNELCNKFNIRGFPHVLADYGDRVTDYEGQRTKESLLEFASSL